MQRKGKKIGVRIEYRYVIEAINQRQNGSREMNNEALCCSIQEITSQAVSKPERIPGYEFSIYSGSEYYVCNG